MKQLFKLGIADCLGSLLPILFWMLAGKIYGTDYANGFILSYPMQFVYGLLFSVCITGANKAELKCDGKVNYSNAGWLCFALLVTIPALIVSAILYTVYGDALSHNLKIGLFGAYLLGVDWLVYADMRKLQYLGKSVRALILILLWGGYRLYTLSIMGLFLSADDLLWVCPLVTTVGALLVCSRFRNWKSMRFSVKEFVTYSSASIAHNIGMSIIYTFGVGILQGSAVELTSYNAVTLCTDTQWDMLGSVDTYVTRRVAVDEWNSHRVVIWRDCILYGILLLVSSIIMFAAYSTILPLEAISLGIVIWFIEMASYVPDTIYTIILSYVQINKPSKWLFVIAALGMVVRFIIQCTTEDVYSMSYGCSAAVIFQLICICILYRNSKS